MTYEAACEILDELYEDTDDQELLDALSKIMDMAEYAAGSGYGV